MPLYDSFSPDPAQNTKAPPLGAGERQLPFDRISDTFRVALAAIAELRDETVKKLKGMAFQAPDAVNITGGVISGVTIAGGVSGQAADAVKLFGLTAQQLYDRLYPVGHVAVRYAGSAPPALFPGVVATWELVPAGRYIRTAEAGGGGATGGSSTVDTTEVTLSAGSGGSGTTGSGGGGTTGTSSLTTTQVPGVVEVAVAEEGQGSALIADAGAYPNGTPRRLNKTFGGGGSHSHSLSGHTHSVPAHTHPIDPHKHSVSIAPPFLDLTFYRRTA